MADAPKTHRMDPRAMAIMRRFHPTGDFDSNTALSCDPEGFSRVCQEALEAVDYPRPPFNWPSTSSPSCNFFVIQGMATAVLSRSGFGREARALEARLSLTPPPFDDLPSLLHHFLDLEPAGSDPDKIAKLLAMADEMGLDAAALGQVRKKRVKNPLAHKAMMASDEWTWLVAHQKIVSPFGKSAACELSLPTMLTLIELWLPLLGQPRTLLPTDESFGNLAWFEQAFPMGWSHVDRLGETAVMSATPTFDFESRLTIAYFEMLHKSLRGWELDDARRISFEHRNEYGFNGPALFGQGAAEYFSKEVAPTLDGKSGLATGQSHLAQFVKSLNPHLAHQRDASTLWMLYREVDPTTARVVEDLHFDLEKKENSSVAASRKATEAASAKLARFEKFVLECGQATVWTAPDSSLAPTLPVPSKSSMRL